MRGFRNIIFIFVINFPLFAQITELSWKRIVSEPFEILYVDPDFRNSEKILQSAHFVFPYILENLGLEEIQPITIIIAPTDEQFIRLTRNQIPEWGIAAASPSESAIILKSPRFFRHGRELEQVVSHELSHILLAQKTGTDDLPRWFDEGVAQYNSGVMDFGASWILSRAVWSGTVLNFFEIEDILSYNKDRASLAYKQAHSALLFLVGSYGEDVVQLITNEIARGQSLDASMKTVMGMDTVEFEKDWLGYLNKKYRMAVFLEMPVFNGFLLLFLFLSAVLVKYYRSRMIRLAWEKEGDIDLEEKNK